MQAMSVNIGRVGAVHRIVHHCIASGIRTQVVDQFHVELVAWFDSNSGARITANIVNAVASSGKRNLSVAVAVLPYFKSEVPL